MGCKARSIRAERVGEKRVPDVELADRWCSDLSAKQTESVGGFSAIRVFQMFLGGPIHLPHPPAPIPRGDGGAGVALGKRFYFCGGVAVSGNVSGLDAILPRPLEGPRASRTTAGGSRR